MCLILPQSSPDTTDTSKAKITRESMQYNMGFAEPNNIITKAINSGMMSRRMDENKIRVLANLRAFLEKMMKDDRLKASLLDVGDGMAIATKIK